MLQTRLRALVIFLYLLAVANGMRTLLLPEQHPIDLLFGAAVGGTCSGICLLHARVNGRRFVHAFQWTAVGLWPVAVPGYFLWVRGIRGLGTVLLHAFLLLFVSGVTGAVTSAVTGISLP